MTRRSCDYCGLIFTGGGYSPDGERNYCCYGCYLVQRIIGAQGDEGIAAWILIRLGIGAFLAMNVMMISLVLYTVPAAELGESTIRGFRFALVVLSTPAVVILGGPFILGAASDLRRGRISTDALIATGSLAAYGVSLMHVLRDGGHIYFDTATMLLLVVTLGRLLEASAKNRTSRAVREMMELLPNAARVLREGREVEIPSSDVEKGDLMVVKPGERLPADGRIISGECMVEESAFTGESRPRSCSPGDALFGGSVNCDGLIMVEASAVGEESLLSQIRTMVEQASFERAPIERLTERVASVFVPLVWLIAALAAAYWGLARGDLEQAGLSALAVLVVACPCALGLATPMATCLAIGKAAHSGVLIRSGEVLERLPAIRRIFFDKTGTLTHNDLSVAQINGCGSTAEEALAWAASLEAGSEHAVGRAIVAAARTQGVPLGSVSDLRTLPGRGVAGNVMLDGTKRRVTVGTLKLLSEKHEVPEVFLSSSDQDQLTTTYVGWDGLVRAGISLQDRQRADARAAIDGLKRLGIATAVISGDREAPTRRLARELDIEDVFFECAPSEKADAIRGARDKGAFRIGMVGDGINDAPALAEADVGIAVGGGTDLAREASDLTLLGDDLTRIPWVLGLSRATYRIIRQNLLWAFSYNSIAVVLAFCGFVHPLIAASAMVLSSLAVIANSMRLLRERAES